MKIAAVRQIVQALDQVIGVPFVRSLDITIASLLVVSTSLPDHRTSSRALVGATAESSRTS
jgi:hypothetical protein